MPIYEYHCPACNHRHERIVAHSATTVECPACGGQSQRTVSAPAYIAPDGGVATQGGCLPRGGFS